MMVIVHAMCSLMPVDSVPIVGGGKTSWFGSRNSGEEERLGTGAITGRNRAQRPGRALPNPAPGTTRRASLETAARPRGSGEGQGARTRRLSDRNSRAQEQNPVSRCWWVTRVLAASGEKGGGDGEQQTLNHPGAGFVTVRPSDGVARVAKEPGVQQESGFPNEGESVSSLGEGLGFLVSGIGVSRQFLCVL